MELTLVQPDDWHCHLRDGQALETTVRHTAEHFSRAIIMPNLVPPVTTVRQALAYRERILAQCVDHPDFNPLMTLYLSDDTTRAMLTAIKETEHVVAVKLYPANATTNAALGVTDIKRCYPLFEVMAQYDIPLLIHGETVDDTIDVFDREAVFIDKTLSAINREFPTLRCVLEHITTQDAVDYVLAQGSQVAATITPHHLLYHRNHMLVGGIKPDLYCLPILKHARHRHALREAAISGNAKFFIGTDSAPHELGQKLSHCGCAGIYSAPIALATYAMIFESLQSLDKLERFVSYYGPMFYQLPINQKTITLKKVDQQVPAYYPFAHGRVRPLLGDETLSWSVNRVT